MSGVYTDENMTCQIDLRAAIWSTDKLNVEYKAIGNFLSDVDWIAETDNEVFLIEYKNACTKKAQNPIAFKEKIKTEDFCDRILKKYYGSVFYMLACGKRKPFNLICVIEAPLLDSFMRKKAQASIKKRLPFELQENPEITIKLIKDFKVVSITEWNREYPAFPLIARPQ